MAMPPVLDVIKISPRQEGLMAQPKNGEYYVTKTLLWASNRDVNRRMIHRWPDDKTVCVFNQDMDEWTEEDERRLQIVLTALRQAACA